MKWKTRIFWLTLAGFVIAQGIGNLRAHHYAYWNSSYKFIFYPETQITCGVILAIVALLPLRRFVDCLTAPYLNTRHPALKPFWKRRHDKF